MSVEIEIREHGCDPKRITLSRVPSAYEFITLAGTEYQAVSINHCADVQVGVQAIVGVMRERTE